MSKVIIRINLQNRLNYKTFEIKITQNQDICDLYENTRKAWPNYYVECSDASNSWTLSNSYTYEQESILAYEDQKYKEYLEDNQSEFLLI